ncbi:MAG: PilX N-terminal domain-containing pilus assembly protein [Alcanivoracaceae bacterium]
MALLIALLILVVISIIGVAAMRTSIFNTKISTSAQGATMTFQAAESALASLFIEASNFEGTEEAVDNVIYIALRQLDFGTFSPVDRCVTKDNLFKAGACAANDVFDERGLLQASSRLVIRPKTVPCGAAGGVVGDQVSVSGESGGLVRGLDYEFVAVGHGRLDALNIESFTVQEFARCIQTPLDGSDV